jgi:hypothetical protein
MQAEIKRHNMVSEFKVMDINNDNATEIIAINNDYCIVYKVIEGKIYNIGEFFSESISQYEDAITGKKYTVIYGKIYFRDSISKSLSLITITDNKLIIKKILTSETSMDGEHIEYYDADYSDISKEEYEQQYKIFFKQLEEIEH